MIIDYSKIEKINFLSKDIDDTFNIKVLKSFEKFYHKAIDFNLNFLITGGIGSIIVYNKIYRTLVDIDILINPEELKQWFMVFKDDYNFCFEDHYIEKPERRLFNFLNKKIDSLVFFDIENEVKIEIMNSDLSNSLDYYKICLNNYLLNVKVPKITYELKKNFKSFRDKDAEDWIFFEKYLSDIDINEEIIKSNSNRIKTV